MIRKAKISDSKQIYTLINAWAKKGKVLRRSLNYVYENIRNFWVFTQDKKIVGCCALGVVGWEDLAEIKSLAVSNKHQGEGIGANLVKSCLEEAKLLGVKNVFALTFAPGFFKKFGFKKTSRKKLPHKIWSDCINCVHFPKCKEEAVIIKITA